MRPTRSQQRRSDRERRKSYLARLATWYENQRRALTKHYAREFEARRVNDDQKERERLVNSMTNWQRNKFGAAHKGQRLDTIPLDRVRFFAAMPHWKKGQANG